MASPVSDMLATQGISDSGPAPARATTLHKIQQSLETTNADTSAMCAGREGQYSDSDLPHSPGSHVDDGLWAPHSSLAELDVEIPILLHVSMHYAVLKSLTLL
jgi:hypothetical protein